MNARLTDRLAVSIKDNVRSAHFQVKQRARSATINATKTSTISQQVAIVADVIIGTFGSAAAKVFTPWLDAPRNIVFPDTIANYFLGNNDDGWKFASETFDVITDLVHRFTKMDCLIYESTVAELYVRMMERHVFRLKGAQHSDALVVPLCSALAVEFASLRPIKAWIWQPDQASSPRHFFLGPNQYVAFVIALSIAVKSRFEFQGESSQLSDEDIVSLVDLAVDARFTDLSGALKQRHSTERLAEVFLEILPFIG